MKKILCLLLAAAMVLSLAGCGKSEAAQAVDDLIAAIGEVTLDSESAIREAEQAMAALTRGGAREPGERRAAGFRAQRL